MDGNRISLAVDGISSERNRSQGSKFPHERFCLLNRTPGSIKKSFPAGVLLEVVASLTNCLTARNQLEPRITTGARRQLLRLRRWFLRQRCPLGSNGAGFNCLWNHHVICGSCSGAKSSPELAAGTL